MYETAPGVEVDYGPRGVDVDVDVDGEGDPRKDASDRCAATTTKGTRCKNEIPDDSHFCPVHERVEA
jgi:hypothetical protein